VAYIYILAHLLAAVLACNIFAFVSGWGPLSPMQSMQQLDIPWNEAVMMWVTGGWHPTAKLPPTKTNKRLLHTESWLLLAAAGSACEGCCSAGTGA
jgi:hypothetical protein